MTVYDFLDTFDSEKDFMVCVIELESLEVLYNGTFQDWLSGDFSEDITKVDERTVFSAELTTLNKGIVIYV